MDDVNRFSYRWRRRDRKRARRYAMRRGADFDDIMLSVKKRAKRYE